MDRREQGKRVTCMYLYHVKVKRLEQDKGG